MTHAETLVDPLLLRQALSWQAGGALSLARDVPEEVVRCATPRNGDIVVNESEAIVQVDLSGRARSRVRVGHRQPRLYVWIEGGRGVTAEQFRIDVGVPFDGARAQVKMAYGVLTVRLPLLCSDESGLRRRV